VIEARIRSLGEIADLAPGKTGKLTVNLKAGTYLLICNQPGHYKDGMTAKVTPRLDGVVAAWPLSVHVQEATHLGIELYALLLRCIRWVARGILTSRFRMSPTP
jgi:hypothetical protein